MKLIGITLGLLLTAAFETGGVRVELIERFDASLSWQERKLGGGETLYTIEEEDDGNSVLRVESLGAASALWNPWTLGEIDEGRLSWRWKIEASLEASQPETTREGDDYAARMFVIFDPVLFDGSMRALCYVWAGKLPEAAVFPSPYSERVATIVLRSGDERAGDWVLEDRDFVEDFRRFFGKPPEQVTAVALMVDTDNTSARATAWFDDIILRAQ